MRGTFTLKDASAAVNKLHKKLKQSSDIEDKLIERKVRLATQMVFQVAHQRRPYITNMQAKLEGRRLIGKGKYHRVSDPNAQAGVPVAMINGGTLQASVKTQFKQQGRKFQGRVFVDSPGAEYGSFLEYGTSKMRARSFMRPAVNLTKEAIRMMLRKHA